MKEHRLQPCPGPDDDLRDFSHAAGAADSGGAAPSSMLDVCRCPKCDGPMTLRQGKHKPYFQCQCVLKPAAISQTKDGPDRACAQIAEKPSPAAPQTALPLAHSPG